MIALSVAVLTLTSPCVNTPRSIANDAAYKNAGNSFKPFFELGNQVDFWCVGRGGVWIGGKWALCTAHTYDRRVILKEYRDKYPEDMVSGKSITITTYTEEEIIPVEKVFLPETLLEKDPFGYDLCLVKLTRTPKLRKLKPATLSTLTDLLGRRVVCSGYGELGLGSTGKDGLQFKRPHPGMRFGFENVIEMYTENDAVARFIFDKNGLPLEGALSGGDSGTGMFTENNGIWELVGINAHSGSSGLQHKSGANKSIYGSRDGAIRLSLFLPEIKRTLEENDPSTFTNLSPETLEKRKRAMTPKRKLEQRPQPSDGS